MLTFYNAMFSSTDDQDKIAKTRYFFPFSGPSYFWPKCITTPALMRRLFWRLLLPLSNVVSR